MAEKPILFSGSMVRAILEGRKTHTRRVINFPESFKCSVTKRRYPLPTELWRPVLLGGPGTFRIIKGQRVEVPEMACMSNEKGATLLGNPYGEPGDRLWVRETLQLGARNNPEPRHNHLWRYAADNAEVTVSEKHESDMRVWAHHKEGEVCVSIHMPRWASRLNLEITGVRVERVQDISNIDAMHEGVAVCECIDCCDGEHPGSCKECAGWASNNKEEVCSHCEGEGSCPICNGRPILPSYSFKELWNSINSARGFGWDVNPWVWVVEFKRVLP